MARPTVEQDERRLKELQAIPGSRRTPDEEREYSKLSTRISRRKSDDSRYNQQLVKRAAAAETQEQFWQMNRAEEGPELIAAWFAQQEVIEDQLFWMAHWQELTPDDPCFVSLADGIDIAEDTNAKRGFIKDAFSYQSKVLNEFEPTWAIWADRSFRDPIWGKVEPYWKNPEVLNALIEENEPTRIWALFGIRTGIPEYHFLKWKQGLGNKVS